MAVVSLPDVQQWLEQTKLTLTDIDASLAETATAVAFGIVGDTYVTTGWVDRSVTPAVIRVAISYLIAAWHYNRAYAENSGPADYGLYLEEKGMAILDGVRDGSIGILEVPGTVEEDFLSFYPNDATGAAETFDGMGNLIGAAGNEDRKFYIGTKF